MKSLRMFRQWETESKNYLYFLVAVRWFLTNCHDDSRGCHHGGIDKFGEYCQKSHPLPDVLSVANRFKENGLILATAYHLRRFREDHEREFCLNRVYGRSTNNVGFCWVNPVDIEVRLPDRYSFGEERYQLLERERQRIESIPTGYTGEMCFLGVRRIS